MSTSITDFLRQAEREEHQTYARAFVWHALIAAVLFTLPLVLIDFFGAAYDPWIRRSHWPLAILGYLAATQISVLRKPFRLKELIESVTSLTSAS